MISVEMGVELPETAYHRSGDWYCFLIVSYNISLFCVLNGYFSLPDVVIGYYLRFSRKDVLPSFSSFLIGTDDY